MGVTNKESGVLGSDGQIGNATWPHIGQIHIAAMLIGCERVDRIDLG